ncbi:hypothetical protein [Granulicella pectinivorans]|uniref:hypothetical protein n=1 Tax=Granulicella pectinivorans TaxID=474950 RepID=UPI0011404F25|nr:hypothetical protein [Granulicella pectinivorans]
MRRLLSILLLLAFGLPGVTPLFALSSAEGTVPVCCRRAGAHHCAASADATQGTRVSAPGMHCPFCPSTAPGAGHVSPLMVSSVQQELPSIASHPTGVAQTESKLRIAESRSRSERGPPQLTSL